MFILTAARQQPVSLLANFSIVLGILWRKYGICGRGISDQNFFSIPRLKSKVWSGNILCIYGHMWSWSFFLFHFCRSGGIPAAAFDAGINPKFLNRVQLVPLFKSHFIQCYRLTLSSYYWWCRYKSLSHNCAGAISLSHVLSGNSFLVSLLFTLSILNQI